MINGLVRVPCGGVGGSAVLACQVSRLGDALEAKKDLKESARRTRCGRAPRRTFPGQLTCPGTYVPKVLMYSMWVGKYPPPLSARGWKRRRAPTTSRRA